MLRPVACDYSPLCFQSFGIRVQVYGLVNKFVVRKTGLEVVESYLDIYARFELNRASCLYRCFLKTAHIAQERREILVVFGELWVIAMASLNSRSAS